MPVVKPKSREIVPYKHTVALSRRVTWLMRRLDEKSSAGDISADKGASFERAEMEALLFCMGRLGVPYKKHTGRKPVHTPARNLEEPPKRPDAAPDEPVCVWRPGVKGLS